VTSQCKGRWILPECQIEPGETASQHAATETFEEPGVLETVSSQPLATSALMYPSRAKVYALIVKAEWDRWPEMNVRERAWLSLYEARTFFETKASNGL